MKIWGLTQEQLEQIAQEVGVQLYEVRENGRALQFSLRPAGERNADGHLKWQRRSASWMHTERRVHAVCYHGHYHFYKVAFAQGATRIKTALADYAPENFEDRALDVGYRNIGAPIYPVQMNEACFCSETGDDYLG